MNTRRSGLSTHVTEMVTGVDIVKEQLRIASGFETVNETRRYQANAYAVESRINAEDS